MRLSVSSSITRNFHWGPKLKLYDGQTHRFKIYGGALATLGTVRLRILCQMEHSVLLNYIITWDSFRLRPVLLSTQSTGF